MRRAIGSMLMVALLATPAWADAWDDEFAAAEAKAKAGDRKSAGEMFRALAEKLDTQLAKTPDDAHLLLLKGRIQMGSGKEDKAAAVTLDKALKLDPKNPDVLAARALLYQYTEEPEKALPLFKQAAALSPEKAKLWVDVAHSHIVLKQYEPATEAINKAIALEPKNPRHLGVLGNIYLDTKKSDEALKTFQRSVEIDPAYALGFYNIGQIHQSAKRYAESLAAFETLLKINGQDWRAWSKLVQLNEALGKIKERDAAREKLFALHKEGKIEQTKYCREQYAEGAQQVMVFEFFELKGERAMRYEFALIDDKDELIKKVTLGSYDMTTAIAREQGTIKADERMFHLDAYGPGGHETLGMFTKEPDYEATRKMVNAYIGGTLKARSSTSLPAKEKP